jgi:leucyl-tRNA---protein transferase
MRAASQPPLSPFLTALQRPLQPFHRSGPMPCPYLPGRIERKLFTRLSGPYAAETNATLSRAGFRRSHDLVYRPVCPGCQACVPVRVPVASFAATRTQRRVERAAAALAFAARPAKATAEQYALFAAYQQGRHADSDMASMSFEDYATMIEDGSADTAVFELRAGDERLIGAMLVDRLTDGASAVYSFFDPEREAGSLGTALILKLIRHVAESGGTYVYLGYWIAECRKMAYKIRFRPLEALSDDGWRPFADGGAAK